MPPTSTDGLSPNSSASADALSAVDLHLGRRVRGVSFHVARGEILAILGPSGAGKTSLLRVVAGLESAQSGALHYGGGDLLSVPAERRRMAFVFQEGALFPHLTIAQNLAFGMRPRDSDRIAEVARALEIEPYLHLRPANISGGERQRAAIARAVLSDPRVLLLDEPFAHLDPQLRVRVRDTFVHFARTWGGPILFVTHDHEEALASGTRIAILMQGRIVQCDTPQLAYERPATIEVAKFLGTPAINVLEDANELIAIRPEDVRIDDAGQLRGIVMERTYTGAQTYLRVQTARGEVVVACSRGQDAPSAGVEVGLNFEASKVLRYDRRTGALI